MFAIRHQAHPSPTALSMVPYSIEEWGLTWGTTMQKPRQERYERSIARAPGTAKDYLMQLAIVIEPDARRLSEWWTQTPINELGSHTADELVAEGLEKLVEKFLLTILFGDRG